ARAGRETGRGAAVHAFDRGAVRPEHRRGARRGEREARILGRVSGTWNLVGGSPALLAMDREERTLETIGDHCEECGAKLTRAELKAALESGGPALCSVHAAEDEPGLAVDDAGFDEPA